MCWGFQRGNRFTLGRKKSGGVSRRRSFKNEGKLRRWGDGLLPTGLISVGWKGNISQGRCWGGGSTGSGRVFYQSGGKRGLGLFYHTGASSNIGCLMVYRCLHL